MLAEAAALARADRDLAVTAAGRVLRQRIDFSILVAADAAAFAAVAALDASVALEMRRLATAPLPLLTRHDDDGLVPT